MNTDQLRNLASQIGKENALQIYNDSLGHDTQLASITSQVAVLQNPTGATPVVSLSSVITSEVDANDVYSSDGSGSLAMTCLSTRYWWSGAFFDTAVTEINFTFSGTSLWILLSSGNTAYSGIRMALSDTRRLADFNPPAVTVRVQSPYGTYNLAVGDAVTAKLSTDRLSVNFKLKKVGEVVYSDWFTFRKSDYPLVLNWGTGAFTQFGIAPEITTTEVSPKTVATKAYAGTLPTTVTTASLPISYARYKKYNALGDSITQGINTTKTYVTKLQERLGITTIRNYGISGTKLANDGGTDSTSFVARYTGMSTDADLITVFGGTNDYGNGTSLLGVMTDRVVTTFYGALHVLFAGLKTTYPLATIIAITPLKRNWSGAEASPDYTYHNSLKLLDYVNAIIQVAGYYGIPVLDLYNKSNLYPYPYTSAAVTAILTDGLHPNEAGHEIIARMLAGLLDTL